MSFLKLIRYPNLAIVVLTQYLLYYLLIRRVLRNAEISPVLDDLQFGLLVFITVLITASGYIFNDIIDFKSDQLNKPDRVMLGKKVPFQIAYWSSGFMLLIGFLLSFYLAMALDRQPYLLIYPIAVMGLLAYNLRWKGLPLIGNLTIAIYCAGVAGILWLAEEPSLNRLLDKEAEAYQLVGTIFIWYMLFAFFSTLIREVVKDMEDVEGDRIANLKTMPIAWGARLSKAIALCFSLLLFGTLVYYGWTFNQVFEKDLLAYLCFGILLPLSLAIYWLIQSKQSSHFHRLSQLWKGIMVLGLLMLLLF